MSITQKLKCPYCNHTQPLLDLVHYDHEDNCEKCRMWFVYLKRNDGTYFTRKADCLNSLSEHDWISPSDSNNEDIRYCRLCERKFQTNPQPHYSEF